MKARRININFGGLGTLVPVDHVLISELNPAWYDEHISETVLGSIARLNDAI